MSLTAGLVFFNVQSGIPQSIAARLFCMTGSACDPMISKIRSQKFVSCPLKFGCCKISNKSFTLALARKYLWNDHFAFVIILVTSANYELM